MGGQPAGPGPTYDGEAQPNPGGFGGIPFHASGTYVSSGAYQTVYDFGTIPEDEAWFVVVTLRMSSGAGGVVKSSIVDHRSTARRASGGSASVSTANGDVIGSLPGDGCRLHLVGGALDDPVLQCITSEVDTITFNLSGYLYKQAQESA